MQGTMQRKRRLSNGAIGRSLQRKSYYNVFQFAWLWLQGWRVQK